MSLSTSTGRSSSLSGPLAAFSSHFGSLWTASSGGGAAAALADREALGAPSVAPSSEGDNERAASSSEGNGDDVLGVPGVESGDDAMLAGGSVAACLHSAPGRRQKKRETAQQNRQRAALAGVEVWLPDRHSGDRRCSGGPMSASAGP
jgi:hypothetical protein